MVVHISPHNRSSWLAARQQDVTASQIGALFGVHEYLSPFMLWCIKAGLRPDALDETEAMRRGRLLEPVAVQIMREDHPNWGIEHNAASFTYYHDPEARLGATPDVLVKDDRGLGVVQIKSVEASVYRKKWFDSAGDVEAPLWIALQATLEAHLVGAHWAAVAPLVIGHGIEMPLIEIPLVPGVIEQMKCKVAAFWQSIVDNDPPAPDYAADGDLISLIYGDGDPDHEVDLTGDNRIPELIENRTTLLSDLRAKQVLVDAIDAEVKSKMGTAHVAHIGGGKRITWKPIHRDGFYVAPTTIRSIRYPKT